MAIPPRSNEARFRDPDDEPDEEDVDEWETLRGMMLRGDHLLTYGRPLEERRRLTDYWINQFKAADDRTAE